MLESALKTLRCPDCREVLLLHEARQEGREIVSGELICSACQDHRFRITRAIPRFVPPENYAGSFGFQWSLYGDLQVDRLGDHSISRDRFYLQVGYGPQDLEGKRVLEVGCGGGRFSDIVLDAGADLYAVDLSSAIERNQALHPGHPRLHLAQASITALPFAPEIFDLVFCFGVLQHTPSPRASFDLLVPFVKQGGRLAVDIYGCHPKQLSHWKYAVRPITKRMAPDRLHRIIQRAAPILVPISRQVRKLPKLGKALSRFVPIQVNDGFMGKVPPEEEVRWATLETLDALTPAYDRPRPRWALRAWFEGAGMVGIETATTGKSLNYGRGTKPDASA
jgi:2-polyprenyl-3-methyl-5-hydroxy-6-metoxy-1,4-benzoquinol methylase